MRKRGRAVLLFTRFGLKIIFGRSNWVRDWAGGMGKVEEGGGGGALT